MALYSAVAVIVTDSAEVKVAVADACGERENMGLSLLVPSGDGVEDGHIDGVGESVSCAVSVNDMVVLAPIVAERRSVRLTNGVAEKMNVPRTVFVTAMEAEPRADVVDVSDATIVTTGEEDTRAVAQA